MSEHPFFRIRSYAKINWYLRILDQRSDGYHNIDSLVQMIELFDEIEISLGHSCDQISCTIPIPTDEGSLLIRLLDGLRNKHPDLRNRKVTISIRKSIPLGGGLGGGSSNAASILYALNHLLSLKLSRLEMINYANLLGSDIPFFVSGHPFARVEGRGEHITPIYPPPKQFLVLAFPEFGVPTDWAYREWDHQNSGKTSSSISGHELDNWLDQRIPGEMLHLIRNDFEQIVFAHYPELLNLKKVLIELGCIHSFMSGSGSTLIGLTENGEHARMIALALRKKGIDAVSTSTRLSKVHTREYSVDSKGGVRFA